MKLFPESFIKKSLEILLSDSFPIEVYKWMEFKLAIITPLKPDWTISAPDEIQFLKKDSSLQPCSVDPCFKFSKWFFTENMFYLLLLNMAIQRTETEIEWICRNFLGKKKVVKILQVNLFMVGFSHMEPLCGGRSWTARDFGFFVAFSSKLES